MTNNDLSYTYQPYYDKTTISGHEIQMISMKINDSDNIEMPYYNFAIIRRSNEYNQFLLLVMKSATDFSNQFKNIVSSYSPLVKYGISKNCGKFDLKVPSYLNRETQEYYKQLEV